ncbi:MAG: permease [Clostridium sp.]
MNNFTKLIKRYSLFIVSLVILAFIFFISPSIGYKTALSVKSSFIQMISVLPPIMILLGLMDVWIKREVLIKYMGEDSGIKGILLSMLLGSIAAGPMYAAFPFTIILLKKGAKFSNVIIFMNAWCVTKIPTLMFEVSALGFKFTMVRLLVDIPGVILMGYLVYYFVGEEETKKITINSIEQY